MFTRIIRMVVPGILLVALIAMAVPGCSKENSAFTPTREVPPVDATDPANTKTATFALG